MAERPVISLAELAAWFAGRTPDQWFDGPLTVRADRDEIIVTGRLAAPKAAPEGSEAEIIAAQSRIVAFREETRLDRMKIADAAQQRFQRHVSWAAVCGDVEATFTNARVGVDCIVVTAHATRCYRSTEERRQVRRVYARPSHDGAAHR